MLYWAGIVRYGLHLENSKSPMPAEIASLELFERLVSLYDAIGRTVLTQSEWKGQAETIEYQCVDTRRMLMEKARYANASLGLSGVRVRFWLKEYDRIVDKYFAPDLEPVGWFMPVCLGFGTRETQYQTRTGYLGMGVSQTRNIVVTGEARLKDALAQEMVTAEEADMCQTHLRSLRIECMSRRFPPAIVRNFELES